MLFYKNGYNATGINEIIEKSNIAKATLYHHFKSKEAICMTYLNQRHQGFMLDLQNFVETKPQGKPQLLAPFDFLRDLYRKEDFNGCWGIKILVHPYILPSLRHSPPACPCRTFPRVGFLCSDAH